MITTRARACAGKIRHESKAAALVHVVRLSRRGAAFWRLSAYRCKACDGWHVGHSPEPRRVR